MRPATTTLAADAAQPPAVRGVNRGAPSASCTPIPSRTLAKVTADWSHKLGEGATGEVRCCAKHPSPSSHAQQLPGPPLRLTHTRPHPHTSLSHCQVYRGTLDSQPIAVKRLRLPPDASPQVVHMLQKRFRAELGTLSSFSHPRIVKLLHFSEDPASAAHPFSLVFELLEEGSLADWLRGEKGEPSRAGVLSPLERVDAALGIAHGLAYLHGIDSGGEAGAGAGEPTVHRDVKSANVGFTRIGGDLYAKVLECVSRCARACAGPR
jgi:serine/threonine protein kinase